MAKFWYLLFLNIHKRKEYRIVELKSLWLLGKYTLCKTVNFNCIGGKLWVRKASLNLLMSENLIMSNMAFPHWFWMMTIYGKKKFLKIPNYCCHYFQMKDMRKNPKWTMLIMWRLKDQGNIHTDFSAFSGFMGLPPLLKWVSKTRAI